MTGMVQTSYRAITFTCLVTLSAVMAPVSAVEDGPDKLVESRGPHGMSWTPAIPFAEALLRVIGPEEISFERRFAAGEALWFSPAASNGEPLPDGVYTYELRLTPVIDEATRQFMTEARIADRDGNASGLRRHALSESLPRLSGSFSIEGGSLASPGMNEAGQVISDDLIVDGRACVGSACENGEAFGSETMKLKSTVVKLDFIDTSDSLFPDRDWRVRTNRSSSEGFLIEDLTAGRIPFQIEGGARDNALHLTRKGEIGLGTTTPQASIHVIGANSPGLRLDQDGSVGFTPQIWDLSGNEMEFFIEDITAGDAAGSRVKPLRIGVGAPNEALVIDSSGVALAGDVRVGSSREIKHGIEPVSPRELLAELLELEIFTWSYSRDASGARHLGPIAEDFHAGFGLGPDERHISPGDTAGLALAAIQALHQLAGERDAELDRLAVRISELAEAYEELQALLPGRSSAARNRTAPANN